MDGGSTELYAPVNLPDGSRISYAYVRYYDQDASNDIRVRLLCQEARTSSYTTLFDWSSSNTVSSVTQQNISDESLTSATIENYNYQYYLVVTPVAGDAWTTDLRIYSVALRVYEEE
jgi:hypothetical protein